MGRPQRATVSDVAREAQVSTATVVRALKDSPAVVPSTRARVQQAAERLGYRPNPYARDIRRGGDHVKAVGLVTSSFTNTFQAAVAAGAELELREEGLQLLISSTDDDPTRERELARGMLDRRVGALLMMPDGEDRDYLRAEALFGTAVVMVGRPAAGLDVDVVMTDDDSAVALATRKLVDLGHRRFAALAGRRGGFRTEQRLAGFARGLEADGSGGLDTPKMATRHDVQAQVVADLVTAADARETMERLMDTPAPPTAVLALNLGISTGVLLDRVAHRRGTAFVSLDETEISAGLGITAITRDPREVGRQAARLAIERMNSPSQPSRVVTLPSRLIARGSGELPPQPAP